jgi:hypothetical protein
MPLNTPLRRLTPDSGDRFANVKGDADINN